MVILLRHDGERDERHAGQVPEERAARLDTLRRVGVDGDAARHGRDDDADGEEERAPVQMLVRAVKRKLHREHE
eukprot:SAG31_NODE_2762_length_5129_cov_3.337972_5_plen_74_part_00